MGTLELTKEEAWTLYLLVRDSVGSIERQLNRKAASERPAELNMALNRELERKRSLRNRLEELYDHLNGEAVS